MIGAIVGDIAGSRFEWCSRLLFAVSLVVLAGCKYEHSVESATASSNEWAAMTNVVESYTVLPGDTVSDDGQATVRTKQQAERLAADSSRGDDSDRDAGGIESTLGR